MKNHIKSSLLVLGIFLSSCSENNTQSQETVNLKFDYFGEQITLENAVPSSELMSKITGTDSLPIKLKGKISDVCQKKGCWMDVDLGNNKVMKVKFKDYGFFVPKNAAGRETVFEGIAFCDTISVEDLRHYAEDEGLSEAEISSISEPEIEISFEAKGVVIM